MTTSAGSRTFLEHMAFNGTARFPEEPARQLPRVRRHAPSGRTSTRRPSFDETIYELQIPTDSASIEGQAFDILEDWARSMTLDTAEITKERGVVIEEWRSAAAPMRACRTSSSRSAQGLPVRDRLPIGDKQTLETFKARRRFRFYSDWYRPDLMAIVAVRRLRPGRDRAAHQVAPERRSEQA
jgi:zinc protease